MAADHAIPPAARILQLASASWVSAAVSAVATLGVADELAAGPRPVEDVAKSVDAHAPTLYRLLRACADLDVFEEHPGRVFALTPVGEALRSDSDVSMRNFARWVGLPAERSSWLGLTDSVRTGQPAFDGVHGEDVWDHLRARPEVAQVFDGAMTEASRQLIAPVVAAYDFGAHPTVVDVAGGRGALLSAVLRAHPSVRGVLFDQPDVIAGAAGPLAEAGVADRVTVESGDFFTAVPEGGDAYLLSNVLHDWDDERSLAILRNVRRAGGGTGRVLLVEAVLPEGIAPAPTVKLMDLNMLVLCGGRQRTPTEFAELLAAADLRLTRIVPAGLHSVVEAVATGPAHP